MISGFEVNSPLNPGKNAIGFFLLNIDKLVEKCLFKIEKFFFFNKKI